MITNVLLTILLVVEIIKLSITTTIDANVASSKRELREISSNAFRIALNTIKYDI